MVPAHPSELEARIRHLLAADGGLELPPEVVQYESLELNLETYQAAIDDRPLDLTYMEYELLKFLAANPGRVFTREILLSRVWGYEYYGGARTVDVHVRRLRAKLGEEHAGLIQTVRSVGYKFGESRWGLAEAVRLQARVQTFRSSSSLSSLRYSPSIRSECPRMTETTPPEMMTATGMTMTSVMTMSSGPIAHSLPDVARHRTTPDDTVSAPQLRPSGQSPAEAVVPPDRGGGRDEHGVADGDGRAGSRRGRPDRHLGMG